MCGQGVKLRPGHGVSLARLATDQLEPGDDEVFEVLSADREFKGAEQLR